MDTSFYTAARGVRTMQEKMSVISNNLANINTVAYKSKSSVFRDLMYYNIRGTEGQITDLKAGTGVKQVSTNTDFTPANIIPTNMPMDFAIGGERGFFRLMDPATGEYSYTRAGNFHMSDRNGTMYLVSDSDKLVMGRDGNPIIVNDIKNIPFPAVYTFENTNGMMSIGTNEYVPVPKNGVPELNLKARVEKGYLEQGNADLAEEMVRTIEASRAYSLALKMVMTADQVEQTINGLR